MAGVAGSKQLWLAQHRNGQPAGSQWLQLAGVAWLSLAGGWLVTMAGGNQLGVAVRQCHPGQ